MASDDKTDPVLDAARAWLDLPKDHPATLPTYLVTTLQDFTSFAHQQRVAALEEAAERLRLEPAAPWFFSSIADWLRCRAAEERRGK